MSACFIHSLASVSLCETCKSLEQNLLFISLWRALENDLKKKKNGQDLDTWLILIRKQGSFFFCSCCIDCWCFIKSDNLWQVIPAISVQLSCILNHHHRFKIPPPISFSLSLSATVDASIKHVMPSTAVCGLTYVKSSCVPYQYFITSKVWEKKSQNATAEMVCASQQIMIYHRFTVSELQVLFCWVFMCITKYRAPSWGLLSNPVPSLWLWVCTKVEGNNIIRAN